MEISLVARYGCGLTNKKDSNIVKVIDNAIISGDIKLFNDGVQVAFAKGKKLYKLKIK
jgi:hypothetical protein